MLTKISVTLISIDETRQKSMTVVATYRRSHSLHYWLGHNIGSFLPILDQYSKCLSVSFQTNRVYIIFLWVVTDGKLCKVDNFYQNRYCFEFQLVSFTLTNTWWSPYQQMHLFAPGILAGEFFHSIDHEEIRTAIKSIRINQISRLGFSLTQLLLHFFHFCFSC